MSRVRRADASGPTGSDRDDAAAPMGDSDDVARSPRASAAQHEDCLRGVSVVQVGQRVAVAVCGHVLHELGADVVVVDGAVDGVAAVTRPGDREVFDLGKRRHAPSPTGADEALAHLARGADVLLLAPDATDASAWDRWVSDHQVRCDVTAFGIDAIGTMPELTEFEIQAISGLVETTGFPGEPPTPIHIPIVEIMTGLYAATGTILALRARRPSGRGQRIDMALFDNAFASLSTFLSRVLTGGPSLGRIGNMHPSAAPWNAYPTRDGEVLVCAGSDAQWARLSATVGRPEVAADPEFRTQSERVAHHERIDAIVAAWTASRTADECVELLSAQGVAASRVVPIDRYPSEANLAHRGIVRRVADAAEGTEHFVAAWPIRTDRGDAAAARPQDDDASRVRNAVGETSVLPLGGVRVVEIGHYTTAPLIARHCASLGAEVVKVEPLGGESTRKWPPLQGGESIFFRSNNADKLDICLDLKAPDDAATLRALLADADVLVENLKPGSLAKLGLSREALRALNPRLVYCSITGFGVDSIYAGRPAFDTVVQAASGFMDAVGGDGPAVKSGISAADILGAQFGLIAVIAALESRERDGAGASIDLSMQDVAAWATQTAWNGRKSSEDVWVGRCADGYVLAQPSPGAALRPDEVESLVSPLSRRDAVDALRGAGIRAAPVLSVRESVDLPHSRRRGLWTIAHADGFEWPLLASPIRLCRSVPLTGRPASLLDADRAAVLEMLRRDDRRAAGRDGAATALATPQHSL
jgi:crotonobetainyl-CoA:carnitine CoA-transferase CaiB-like acyl-CoA transferase